MENIRNLYFQFIADIEFDLARHATLELGHSTLVVI